MSSVMYYISLNLVHLLLVKMRGQFKGTMLRSRTVVTGCNVKQKTASRGQTLHHVQLLPMPTSKLTKKTEV